MIKITIPGKPIAKKRPRFSRRGKNVTTYSDQKTEEGKFISEVLHRIGYFKTTYSPVKVSLTFLFPRPKRHYGTGRNAGILKPSAPRFHTVKPDIDNCEKFVFDCLNGIVWKDDSQVVASRARKAYSETPATAIRIEPAETSEKELS